MKKAFYLLILILLIGLSFKHPASAQVSPTKTTSRNQLELLDQSKEATQGATISSLLLTKNLTVFNGRVSAAVLRLEKIAGRISSRLAKMKQDGINTAKFNSSYSKINSQLTQLKSDWQKAEELSSKITNTNIDKEYQPFRKQVLVVLGGLEDILVAEKELVAALIKINQ